jgi:DNA-binding XRE family transcriptional regulator
MDRKKIIQLQKNGWRVGETADFLGLTPEETDYIETKIALARYIQKKRLIKHMTQQQLARLIRSSQSRVAKIEKSDPSVSLDLLVRTLFALGATKPELARAIA